MLKLFKSFKFMLLSSVIKHLNIFFIFFKPNKKQKSNSANNSDQRLNEKSKNSDGQKAKLG